MHATHVHITACSDGEDEVGRLQQRKARGASTVDWTPLSTGCTRSEDRHSRRYHGGAGQPRQASLVHRTFLMSERNRKVTIRQDLVYSIARTFRGVDRCRNGFGDINGAAFWQWQRLQPSSRHAVTS